MLRNIPEWRWFLCLTIVGVVAGCNSDDEDPREIQAVRLHRASVTSVAFSPDGRSLATSSLDKTIRVLNMENFQLTGVEGSYTGLLPPERFEVSPIQGVGRGFTDISFSADGMRIAAGQTYDISGGTVELYRMTDGEMVGSWRTGGPPVRSLDFHPTGERIVVATGDDGAFGGVDYIDVQTGIVTPVLTGVYQGVHYVAFSPDGSLVSSAGLHDEVRLLDGVGGAEVRVFEYPPQNARCTVFSPDGSVLVSAGSEEATAANFQQGIVHLWNVESGTLDRSLSINRLPIRTMSISPSGRLLAVAGDGLLIYLIDLPTYTMVGTMRGHLSSINKVAFSPDGQVLASAGDDQYLRLWYVGDLTGALPGDTDGDGGDPGLDGGIDTEVGETEAGTDSDEDGGIGTDSEPPEDTEVEDAGELDGGASDTATGTGTDIDTELPDGGDGGDASNGDPDSGQ